MSRPHTQKCPVAASLNLLGDIWTLLVVREALNGVTRFSQIQRNTGIAKNLLAERLATMVDDGLLERRDIGLTGVRHEYRLTQKGRALSPVMVAISQWGNAWLFDKGRAPIALVNRRTGEPLGPLQPSTAAGEIISWRDVQKIPGPGADAGQRRRFASRHPTKE